MNLAGDAAGVGDDPKVAAELDAVVEVEVKGEVIATGIGLASGQTVVVIRGQGHVIEDSVQTAFNFAFLSPNPCHNYS